MADDVPGPGGETGDPDPGDAEPDVPEPVVPGPAPETAPVTPVVTLEDAPVPLAAQVLDTTEVPAAMPVAAVAPQADLEAEEVVQIEDEEVPLAVLDEEDEEDGLDEIEDEEGLLDIEDEEVPLAEAVVSSGVHHYVQHVCELVASGLLPIFLAGSNRKKKKEVSGLKERLEGGTERKDN